MDVWFVIFLNYYVFLFFSYPCKFFGDFCDFSQIPPISAKFWHLYLNTHFFHIPIIYITLGDFFLITIYTQRIFVQPKLIFWTHVACALECLEFFLLIYIPTQVLSGFDYWNIVLKKTFLSKDKSYQTGLGRIN